MNHMRCCAWDNRTGSGRGEIAVTGVTAAVWPTQRRSGPDGRRLEDVAHRHLDTEDGTGAGGQLSPTASCHRGRRTMPPPETWQASRSANTPATAVSVPVSGATYSSRGAEIPGQAGLSGRSCPRRSAAARREQTPHRRHHERRKRLRDMPLHVVESQRRLRDIAHQVLGTAVGDGHRGGGMQHTGVASARPRPHRAQAADRGA